MQITPNVGAPSTAPGSPETGVHMPASLPSDAGTVDTVCYG